MVQEHMTTIDVTSLSYAFPDGSTGLTDVTIHLPHGSRTLLIGANGAGKTTLLRLLSGKRLAPHGSVSIAGVDPFKEGLEGVTYLGLEWVLNPIVRTDIDVPTLLASVGGDYYSERRDELIQILDIDTSWRMHAVSDGERRRVQLAMGLVRPARVLLLDELTADLDLLSRSSLMAFLKLESETRGTTIIYATHILDNLSNWPTHLIHMHMGTVKEARPIGHWDLGGVKQTGNSELGELVLEWLRADLEERGPRQRLGNQGKTYENHSGKGGYGHESRSSRFAMNRPCRCAFSPSRF